MCKVLIITMSFDTLQAAYNDFRNHYTISSSALPWNSAWNACIAAGKKLARITNLSEQQGVQALVNGRADVYYTGVRCDRVGVAHSWAYDGTNYVKSTGS